MDKIQEINTEDILAIVDGAAFGSMIENCLEYFATRMNQRIAIWMPESFEYLILKSGVISSPDLTDILDSTADYVEAKDYESWERYFTQLLIFLTNGKTYKYSKKNLDEYYMQNRNVQKMTAIFPEAVRKHIDRDY